MKKDRKLLVLKVKRLKDTYDGGGGDGIASCPQPTLKKVAAKPWDLPVFSCKACYSLCDRGSKKHLAKKSDPVPPPWVRWGQSRSGRDHGTTTRGTNTIQTAGKRKKS